MFSGSGKAEGRPRAIPGLARYSVVGYVRARRQQTRGTKYGTDCRETPRPSRLIDMGSDFGKWEYIALWEDSMDLLGSSE